MISTADLERDGETAICTSGTDIGPILPWPGDQGEKPTLLAEKAAAIWGLVCNEPLGLSAPPRSTSAPFDSLSPTQSSTGERRDYARARLLPGMAADRKKAKKQEAAVAARNGSAKDLADARRVRLVWVTRKSRAPRGTRLSATTA